MKKEILVLIIFLLCLSSICNSQVIPDDDSLITKPDKTNNQDQDASFPGGEEKWLEYLNKNLNKNLPSLNKAPKGEYEVQIKFIVNNIGSAEDITPITNFGYGLEEEVIRLISNRYWIPATKNGQYLHKFKIVKVKFFAK